MEISLDMKRGLLLLVRPLLTILLLFRQLGRIPVLKLRFKLILILNSKPLKLKQRSRLEKER